MQLPPLRPLRPRQLQSKAVTQASVLQLVQQRRKPILLLLVALLTLLALLYYERRVQQLEVERSLWLEDHWRNIGAGGLDTHNAAPTLPQPSIPADAPAPSPVSVPFTPVGSASEPVLQSMWRCCTFSFNR